MLQSKNQSYTSRVMLLLISLVFVWSFCVALMVTTFYINGVTSMSSNRGNEKQPFLIERLQHAESLNGTIPRENHSVRRFSQAELHRWRPVRAVKKNENSPGEMGTAVRIPQADELERKKLYKLNKFNLMASDMIALNRSLKDVRYDACKSKILPKYLPDTSVIIIFHNEAWSTLFRTVWSVINRSPRILLKEIILVDDFSDPGHLKSKNPEEKLEDYVKTLPVPTYVFRAKKRSGLTQARLLGAKHATGQVMTFLDSHCECTEGWLEPLLARIAEDRKTVVIPVVDIIDFKTFEYLTIPTDQWGGFSYQIEHKWDPVPQREKDRRNGDDTAPLRTPTMIGGLFSIDRHYFYELGAYDEEMKIWGSENIEMSFRVWQCGGILEIIPCSRVGHVFRVESPYKFRDMKSILMHNGARVAEIWMDEWKDFYYAIYPSARNIPLLNLSERKKLRKNLKCKSFRWYLDNVYPESSLPYDYDYYGTLKNMETHKCLDTMGRKTGEHVGLFQCHEFGGNQAFVYTKENQLRINDDLCLDAASSQDSVKLIKCHNMRGNQTWSYNKDIKLIRHMGLNLCVSTPRSGDLEKATLVKCDSNDNSQKWIMQH